MERKVSWSERSNGVFSAQHQIDMGVVGFAGWCLGLVNDLDIVFMINEGAGATQKEGCSWLY